VPQSNMYRRGLFGGGGALCACAIARGAARARRASKFFIVGSIS
jgi:hypothetical protein